MIPARTPEAVEPVIQRVEAGPVPGGDGMVLRGDIGGQIVQIGCGQAGQGGVQAGQFQRRPDEGRAQNGGF